MKLTLAVSKQYGDHGPQAGDTLEALSWGYDDAGDLFYFCKSPGRLGYYCVYPGQTVEETEAREHATQ